MIWHFVIFELPKGFTKAIDATCVPQITPPDLFQARDSLFTKRNLTLILGSHAILDPFVKPGNFVDEFFNQENKHRGNWLSPRGLLSIDSSAGLLSVPGLSGRSSSVPVEYVRHSISEDDFSKHDTNVK